MKKKRRKLNINKMEQRVILSATVRYLGRSSEKMEVNVGWEFFTQVTPGRKVTWLNGEEEGGYCTLKG